ncbi:sugar ABC transporter substrate-binding protein [Streptomyces sp. NPDC047061]|uniref:sugar ABC transporter substrate-binding protein n=1 Tax=Streptomyces sp. NPDC047061 TaxID=3154605 RepID=UPI0033E33C70
MFRNHRGRARARLTLAATALALALGATACSNTTDDASVAAGGSVDTAKLQKIVDAAMKAPTWQGPTSSPKPAKGKFVIDIPCAQAAVGCSRPGDSFLAAAKELGWRTQMIDPAGDPQKLQAAFQQAVQLGADGIFAPGASKTQVGSLLPKLRKAGIKLITMAGELDKPSATTWDATMQNDYAPFAKVLAAYVALKDPKAKVLVVNDSEYPQVNSGFQAFKKALAAYCPTCSVGATLDFSIVDLQTTFPQKVKASLQSHPDVTWVYAPYDFAGVQINQAILQAGLVGKVKTVGTDGNPQNLQALAEGQGQTASYARSNEWVGYAAADQMNRLFNGEKIWGTDGFGGENYGIQLFDKSNLPSDTKTVWSGGYDFRNRYRELWGLPKS